MGTCFPNAILGEGGYLATHQSYIRKLSLITDGSCVSEGPQLTEFMNVQELSWKGLRTHDDCAALKAFLELHHERITSLEVDFINWAVMEDYFDLSDDSDDDESTPLTDLILPKREDDYEDFLPNLQTFSISAASFKGSWDRLIDAFNLCSVMELRLLGCKCTVELLDYMALTNVPLQVTKVELIIGRPETDGIDLDFIDFLAPFRGLEDLFIMFDADYADEHYTETILPHRDTLRRLVFHRRHYCLAENSPYWEEYCDSSLDEMEGGGLAKVLRETDLESVGICGKPSQLQKSLRSAAANVESLKLLHLRFTGKAERKPRFLEESEAYADSPPPEWRRAYFEAAQNGTTPPPRSPGPSEAEFRARWERIQGENWPDDEDEELEAFANWAFGPDGFPRLQVLASGDFSHGNRFADTRTLWCRETRASRGEKTWRTVEPSDIAENELIDANMDMLSACPVSPLFYEYGRGDLFPGIS